MTNRALSYAVLTFGKRPKMLMTMIEMSTTFNDDLVDDGGNNDVFSCLKQRARIQILVLFASCKTSVPIFLPLCILFFFLF